MSKVEASSTESETQSEAMGETPSESATAIDSPSAKDSAGESSKADAPTSSKDAVDKSSKPARRPAKGSTRPADKFFVSGFWRRGLAACIDLAIVLPVSILLCKVAGALTGLSLPASRVQGLDFWLDLLLSGDSTLIGALGLTLAIASIYSLIFHISMGRTIGMQVLKLRIIDVYGDEPSTNRALLRTAGYLACVASLGLGFIWIAFDSEKRGLQDWLAGTYVVKT